MVMQPVNKLLLKKTKRGNILKIVREHYLRDDLWCGSEACKVCRQDTNHQVLDEVVNSESTLFPQPHYILPDTNVVLDQIDILEEEAIQNVIILYTVLEEVKHRSVVVYKRLKEILKNSDSRKFYVFVNEHHKETYVERLPGESANDRNDRAIRKAVVWYNSHLAGSQKQRSKKDILRVVLLTDDAANKEKADAEKVLVATASEYVNSLKNQPALADKLSSRQCNSEFSGGKAPLFPPYRSPVEIQNGLKTGKLYQGAFLASRENFLEGQVNVENLEKPVLIQGRESLNRAVDGDTVAIELLPESEWSAPSELILEDVEPEAGDVLEEEEERELREAKKKQVEKQPTGKVVGIIRRKWRQYCGILQENPVKGSVRHMFVPAERKIPRIRIETRQAEKLLHQRVIVSIDSWPRNSRYPVGHFVKALGKIGDKETENEVLLLEHDVPHGNFSEAVLSFLPKLPWVITPEDLAKRRDLRHLDVCSVDPPGCTDIDDALHCRLLDNGNYEVGVHIADVSHFIRPGNALDKEAALRATTVYLVDKRIDMVPDLLSSNLCSLREKVDRFAFSCIWEITKDARIVKTDFCKSIIFSRGAFTYKEAQMRIDDTSQQNDIAKSLRGLNSLAKILKKRRLDNGALVLASPEIRFNVDSETHDPIDVKVKEILETNSMVEEFMLLANISVAEKIFQEFPECAMLRRHPEPAPNMFEPLIKAGRHLGFDIKTSSGKELAASLDTARMPSNPYFNTMLRILATRCMMQAVYFCSGMLTKQEYAHYGLATPIYTHFTSPIRRYADIMVHRLLASCIGADTTYPELLDRRQNHSLCHNLNYRNRMAQYAGRASVALYTHIFFRGQVRDEEGYILFVRKNALQILVPRYGLEGTLYLKNKDCSVEFTFNEEDHTQRCGKVLFHAFDPVTVQLSLDASNVQHEKLVFKLVKPFIAGFSVEKGAQSSSEQSPVKRKETAAAPGGKQSDTKKKRKK
ncbi:exosome complex exonuclease RRP44 [Nilaparvata lugens]|uniref:exosome complex exonuclease RRP44 n=1 Tax=Nilaparvata lugens TaxID=108931 RepID=UPI00193D6B32|nr:exosome complex exonuclease RRP44 [Nilaparvata lugens]